MDWHLRRCRARSTAAAGPATPGTASCSPTRQQFLGWLHEHGLRVTLNVHPADGVRAVRGRLPGDGAGAGHRPGRPASRSPSTSPTGRSSTPTSRSLHRPLERDGRGLLVDRLAVRPALADRPASTRCGCSTTSTSWTTARDGRRPLDLLPLRRARAATATRSASPATPSSPGRRSTSSPYFTATASNIGYGWWSHDIGGHMFGGKDDELATRWVQLGVFSPILRLHSSSQIRSSSRSRGGSGRRRRAVMTDVPAPAASAACPTCTR